METRLRRRKYLAAHNWASMDTDILCSIFTRLPYVDLLQVNSTCWGWNAAVDLFKSCSATSSFQEMPWLIFLPYETIVARGEKTGRLVNIEGEKIYPINDLGAMKMNGSCYCVGSSRDWLVCLDEQAIPFLLNPFNSRRIDLPHFGSSLGVEKVYGIGKECTIKTVEPNPYLNSFVRGGFVRVAVLSSSPSLDNNYYLVMIYGMARSLAFCKDGDTSWTKLDAEYYPDVIFHENQLYGFYGRDYNHLIVWDMNEDGFNFVKKIDIMNQELDIGLQDFSVACFFSVEFYLVECQGSLLIVRRFSKYGGEIRNWERSFDPKYLRFEIHDNPFSIFKLDMEQKSWRGVESLCGFALFLARNQSISVNIRNCKILKQDSIYFSDDLVHRSGVFSLKDKCVDWTDWLDGTKRENQRSPPTWVVPRVK